MVYERGSGAAGIPVRRTPPGNELPPTELLIICTSISITTLYIFFRYSFRILGFVKNFCESEKLNFIWNFLRKFDVYCVSYNSVLSDRIIGFRVRWNSLIFVENLYVNINWKNTLCSYNIFSVFFSPTSNARIHFCFGKKSVTQYTHYVFSISDSSREKRRFYLFFINRSALSSHFA